jgi:hypothetical protein
LPLYGCVDLKFLGNLKLGVGRNFIARLFTVVYSSPDTIIGEIRSNSIDFILFFIRNKKEYNL